MTAVFKATPDGSGAGYCPLCAAPGSARRVPFRTRKNCRINFDCDYY